MAPWLDDVPHTIDRQFRNKVLLPGFVDPHVHPFLAGKLLTNDIAAPEAWNLPSGRVEAVTNREDFIARLTELSAAWPHTDRPQIVWGWHRLWHGDFGREDLDAIAPDKPLLIWHRSYHEIVANSRAMEMIPISEEALERFRTVPPQDHYLDYVMADVAWNSLAADGEGGWRWKFDHHSFTAFKKNPRVAARPYLPKITCRLALLASECGLVNKEIGTYMYDLMGRVNPVIQIPLAGHHLMLDQPLLLITALNALLADWDHSDPISRG